MSVEVMVHGLSQYAREGKVNVRSDFVEVNQIAGRYELPNERTRLAE